MQLNDQMNAAEREWMKCDRGGFATFNAAQFRCQNDRSKQQVDIVIASF
jgi:hypothetical protein